MTLLEKVEFLLNIAKNNIQDASSIETVLKMTDEHSDNLVLGRFMGFSVAEYAVATLNWINQKELFNKIYSSLNEFQKNNVNSLIETKMYEHI